MKYDFDTLISRDGTNSSKWRMKNDVLPMWVADMDFKAAPEILNALQKRTHLFQKSGTKRLKAGGKGVMMLALKTIGCAFALALYQRFLLRLEDLVIQEIKF